MKEEDKIIVNTIEKYNQENDIIKSEISENKLKYNSSTDNKKNKIEFSIHSNN